MSWRSPTPISTDRRQFNVGVTAAIAAGLLLRIVYLWVQPDYDPYFAQPRQDDAYYVDWARGIVASDPARVPGGAFYLAPLYPYFVAACWKIAGESFTLLYGLQHLLSLVTAWLLARVTLRAAGPIAGAAAAALFVLHAPLLFFASRPSGETLALALLATSLALSQTALASGFVVVLAAIARPNLLLLPPVWGAGEWWAGRRRHAVLLLAGAALAVLPVAVRNLAVSGHFVPVSSNAGLTAYHGNAPDARGVYYALIPGFSGELKTQRAEATSLARSLSGRELDPVEADRWWGRRALGARLADPAGTLVLVARKALLLIDNSNHGLDGNPTLDRNPWRRVAVVPFAFLLGLTASGLVLYRIRGTGGRQLWAAIGVCAFMPLAFYVSSRYKLPVSALLVVPAGAGLAGLLGLGPPVVPRRRVYAVLAGSVIVAASMAMPFDRLERTALLAGRLSQVDETDPAAAERELRSAIDANSDGTSQYLMAVAHFRLGVVLERQDRTGEAESAYRTAVLLDPGRAEAAGNLALILIRRGDPQSAVPILRAALAERPTHEVCWNNLVVALFDAGERQAALQAAAEADRAGVKLDPRLLEALRDEKSAQNQIDD